MSNVWHQVPYKWLYDRKFTNDVLVPHLCVLSGLGVISVLYLFQTISPSSAPSELWPTPVGSFDDEFILCASPWLILSYSSLVDVPEAS